MQSGSCGENLRWKLDDEVLTISGTGEMDDYSYDAKIAWRPSKESIKRVVIADGVTSIGEYAFDSCKSLTSVTIPDSVTSIGDHAFSSCGLTSVTIPDSVTMIDSHAFYGCLNLTSVIIGNSVTTIGKEAFDGCGLTSVTIPDSVTTIGDYAFCSCQWLKSVTIGNSVMTIGKGAFSGTSLRSVTIPDSVTTIGKEPFYNFMSLREIHYPAGRGFEKILSDGNNAKLIPYTVTPTVQPVTKPIIQAAKSGTCGKNLRWKLDGNGTLTISGTGKMDDYYVGAKIVWLSSKESIKRVVIADGVTSIGNGAFYECNSLTNVTIPDSVTSIGNWAFSGCGLTSVTIPDSVTSIGEKPVYNCRSLKEIHYPAGRGFEKNLLQFNNAKLIPYNVATPVKSTTQPAKSGTCGKNLRWKLDGSGTLTISGTGKMDDYYRGAKIEWLSSKESIKRVVIADGVTSIGNWAFRGCEKLTSVTIPDSVTSIGNWAFGCEKLTSVTIPDSVTSIGNGTFNGCKSLASVTIGNSVTSIGNGAFRGCKSLASVTIGNSVTSIGNETFNGCTSLKEIHYPAGRGFEKNLSQGNNAKLIPYTVTPTVTKPTVQNITRPTTQSVTQPKPTVQTVAEKLTWSFAGKTLTVGGVREIKFFPYAQIPWIKHLHDIQRIVVGDGVEKIAAHTFEECKRLELVTLPASVKTIGDMFASVSFCGDRFVNGGRNVFWCLENGVLVLKKNPAAKSDADFSTGFASWIFADKNIHGVKLERGIKPTENFFAWLSSHDGAAISFG